MWLLVAGLDQTRALFISPLLLPAVVSVRREEGRERIEGGKGRGREGGREGGSEGGREGSRESFV